MTLAGVGRSLFAFLASAVGYGAILAVIIRVSGRPVLVTTYALIGYFGAAVWRETPVPFGAALVADEREAWVAWGAGVSFLAVILVGLYVRP